METNPALLSLVPLILTLITCIGLTVLLANPVYKSPLVYAITGTAWFSFVSWVLVISHLLEQVDPRMYKKRYLVPRQVDLV